LRKILQQENRNR